MSLQTPDGIRRLQRKLYLKPGVDGVAFTTIEAAGLEEWLSGLRTDLVGKTCEP